MATSNQQTECVLLVSAAAGTDAREQLHTRGWSAHVSNEPLPALAELCLLERLAATRRAWGRQGGGVALVVVEPARWAQLPAMISAARRYVPTARLWTFADGTLTPLAESGESDNGAGAGGEANATPPPSYQMRSEPEAATGTDGGDQGSPQITGDEISMLLDGNFRDEIPETPQAAPEEAPEQPDNRDTPATDPEA